MSSYWVNFAASGNPNGQGLPVWPAFKEKTNEQAIVLGEPIGTAGGPDPVRAAFYDAAGK